MDKVNTKKLIKKGITEEEIAKYEGKELLGVNLHNHFSVLLFDMGDGEYKGITTSNGMSTGADFSEPRYAYGKKIGEYNVLYLVDHNYPLRDSEYVHKDEYERYIIDGETCIQKYKEQGNTRETVSNMSDECMITREEVDTDTLLKTIETSKHTEINKVFGQVKQDMEYLSSPMPDESGCLMIEDVIAKDKEMSSHHLG